jgi:hypothetical protein
MGGLRRFAVRFVGAYVVFGIAQIAVSNAYCNHRVAVGKPSDLPCGSLLWDSIEFSGWPIVAISYVFSWEGATVPFPIHLRVIETALVAGYGAALVWAFAGLVPKPPSAQ